MSSSSGFDKFVDFSNREIALLFQRLNYFLVGSAFLVTAFATLVASAEPGLSPIKLNLAYMINLVGFYLSLFFAYINFLNTKIILYKDEMIRDIESKPLKVKNDFPAFTRSRQIVIDMYDEDKLGNNQLITFFKMLKEVRSFGWNTQKAAEGGGLAPHTYLIPLGFWLLWFILYFLILYPICWVYTLAFFLPLLIWITLYTLKYPIRNKIKSFIKKAINKITLGKIFG